MITSRIDLAISYVASQLIDHWLLLAPDRPGIEDETTPEGAGLAEWTMWCEGWCDHAKQHHVLAERLRKKGLTARCLASEAYQHFQNCRDQEISSISMLDPKYPSALKALARPPLYINCLGDVARLSEPTIAVVGARKASARAKLAAFELGRLLGQARVSVVSGGAFGCDIAAHQGSLCVDDTAHAIVVMAGGLSSLYPKQLEPIFRRLLAKGALIISERLYHQQPLPYHFPVRNRIIAGLSEELVLLQAARKSGAMITALAALNHGRPVYVLQSDGCDVRFEGNLLLEQEGAPSFYSALEYMYLSCYHGS